MNYLKLYEPFFGDWQLEEKLGQDRLGSVYKISKNNLDKKYESILKIISVAPSNLDNINSELDTLSSLDQNILQYKDHSIIKRYDNMGYDILIRMDYSYTLPKFLENNNITKKDVIMLAIDILTALEKCHEQNIIHKNINPDSIFFNANKHFCLGNFDLSVDRDNLLVKTENLSNYFYQPPEIFNSGKFSNCSDLYSLGIVLYKLLNNNMFPFAKNINDDSKLALFKRLSSEEVPNPAQCEGQLAKIILKAISFNVSKRYQSAKDMKNDFLDLLATFNEPDFFLISSQNSANVTASGNNINGNLVILVNDTNYLINLSDGQKIYKINKKENIYKKLFDDHADNLIYYKDLIYFINRSDNDKIYETNVNGSSKKIVLDKETTWFLFYKDWLYYTSYDGKLFRIKPNGLDNMCINKDSCKYISMYKDTLYYVNESDNNYIYKFDIATKNKIRLNSTSSLFVNIYKNQIFYSNLECNKIYRMELNGGEKCVICNVEANFLNIYKDYIYFSNVKDYNNLYKININGLNLQKLNNDYTKRINILNDWIYYENFSDNGCLYMITIDGNNKTKISPILYDKYLFLD
ncbi:MAG: DUF5050 domain-containing protein [Clostridiales bacterium]|nr:DUF5050 domain-containing protein [Clostridiales bacterium]